MPLYHTPAGPVETQEWGEGEDVWVLAHAAAAGPNTLSGLAKRLAAPGRRLVAVALNGYGGTALDVPGGPIAAHAAAVDAVLTALPARRRTLFGHSMGGLASLVRRTPVDRLVVFDPIVTAVLREDDPEDAAARAWDLSINDGFYAGMAAGDPERAIATFIEAWNEQRWTDIPASARARLTAAAPRLGADMRACSTHPAVPYLGAPEVVILQGARSPEVTHRMTARLAALLPGARRVVIEGGHMAPIFAADAVAGAVTAV